MKVAKHLIFYIIFIFSIKPCDSQERDTLEIIGFIQTDAGYNFNSIDANWYDVMRITKLPSGPNQLNTTSGAFFSVRQSRFGIRSKSQTKYGELFTRFDFDFFGVGSNVGQTNFHLINAYVQIGRFGAGLYNSVFMNLEVFPVTLDYWGPSSRVYYQNIQVRYSPVQSKNQVLTISLEGPAATADKGDYSEQVEINGIKPHYILPNFLVSYRRDQHWGFFQLGSVLKLLSWKAPIDTGSIKLSGQALGWGVNVSSVINISSKIKFKLQGVGGAGAENHLADPPPDVGLAEQTPSTSFPHGKAIPFFGFFAFAEISWSAKVRSSVGYSLENVSNTNLQKSDAFRTGHYALFNFRYYPVANLQLGLEYQYGSRYNYKDHYDSFAHKIQFSIKQNFSARL